MALQSSGAISLADIAGEFGGSTPHSINEYYGVANGVPSSGAIDFADFYGTSSFQIAQGTMVGVANRMDNFGVPLFTHAYLATRTINQYQGNPPGNIGYVQDSLDASATGPSATATSYAAMRGNQLSLVGGLGVLQIDSTQYFGSWNTDVLEDGDFGNGFTITYFSDTNAGAALRTLTEGNQGVFVAWYN